MYTEALLVYKLATLGYRSRALEYRAIEKVNESRFRASCAIFLIASYFSCSYGEDLKQMKPFFYVKVCLHITTKDNLLRYAVIY